MRSNTFWSCDTIATVIGISVTWCLKHHKWDHYILGQDDRSEVQHDFLGCMIPLTLVSASCDANSIVNGTIPLLTSRYQNEVQHDFLGHMTLVAPALASHDADGIVNSAITFFVSRCSEWGATWLFQLSHAIDTDVGITWCCQYSHCHQYISLANMIKWDLSWLLWSHNTIVTGIGITWYHWCWYHMIPFGPVSVSHDANRNINGIIVYLR